MLKRTALTGLGLVLLLSPLLVSADTLSDLQAQVQQLLTQIQALQQNANQTQGTSGGTSIPISYPPVPTVYNGYSCVSLSHSLSQDDSDADTSGDVSKLQSFLAQDPSIYPGGSITGYFGPATLRAVQRWQSSHRLASSGNPDTTGYGYVGPKTRAAMTQGCGGISQPTLPPLPTPVPQPDDNSTVAPVVNGLDGPSSLDSGQSGTWTVNASVPSQPGAHPSYSVTWGDENYYPRSFGPISPSTQTSATFTHAYQFSGNYRPRFTVSNSVGWASAEMSVTVVGTTASNAPIISVTSPNGGGYWYKGAGAFVEWRTANIPNDNQMLIRLRSVDTNQEYNLATVYNDGNERLIVPTSIPSGAYNLEIKTTVGDLSYVDASDSYFKVVESPPTVTVAPIVEFIGTPTITLQYDPAGREAYIVSNATVKVTSGNSSLNVGNLAYILRFWKDGRDAGSNSTRYSAIDTRNGTTVTEGSTVQANTSAMFSITGTAPTRELFAGTYTLTTSGFYYFDANHIQQTIQPTSFLNAIINADPGNRVTIIGETSPYINSITLIDSITPAYPTAIPAGQAMIITGVRFDPSLNSILIDGQPENKAPSYGGTRITFIPSSDSGITPGFHTLQIQTANGASNRVPVMVGGTTHAPVPVTLTASPSWGIAPLSTSFNFTAGIGQYGIDFGDGNSTPVGSACSSNCGITTYNALHIYNTPGSYVARLFNISNQTLGSVTISATGQTSTIPSITDFSLNGTNGNLSVTAGTPVGLTWHSTNTTGCTISYGRTDSVASNSVSPITIGTAGLALGQYTYFLNCSGANGSSAPQVTRVLTVVATTAVVPTVSWSPANVTLPVGGSLSTGYSSTNADYCRHWDGNNVMQPTNTGSYDWPTTWTLSNYTITGPLHRNTICYKRSNSGTADVPSNTATFDLTIAQTSTAGSCTWNGGNIGPWGVGCNVSVPARTVSSGQSTETFQNTVSGFKGSISYTCNNGSFVPVNPVCTAAPTVPGPTIVWWSPANVTLPVGGSLTTGYSSSNADYCRHWDENNVLQPTNTGSYEWPATWTLSNYTITGPLHRKTICYNSTGVASSPAYFDLTIAQTSAPTATLSQSVSSTVSGAPYTISWGSTGNTTSCTVTYIGPDGGGTISNGPTSGGPLQLTTSIVGTYTATNTCTWSGGTVSSSPIQHFVTAPAPPTVSWSPANVTLPIGGSLTTGYSSTNADYCRHWDGNNVMQPTNTGTYDWPTTWTLSNYTVTGPLHRRTICYKRSNSGSADVPSNTATFELTIAQAAAAPAPTISSINPSSITTGQTTNFTVTGTNFQSGAVIYYTGTYSGSPGSFTPTFNSYDPTHLTFATGPLTAGSYNFYVQNLDGQRSGNLTLTVTAPAAPTVSWSPANVALPIGGSLTTGYSSTNADYCRHWDGNNVMQPTNTGSYDWPTTWTLSNYTITGPLHRNTICYKRSSSGTADVPSNTATFDLTIAQTNVVVTTSAMTAASASCTWNGGNIGPWGAGCNVYIPARTLSSGQGIGGIQSDPNIAPGYTGSISVTCNNGSWAVVSSPPPVCTKNPLPPDAITITNTQPSLFITPTLTFTADSPITAGQSSTLRWSSGSASECWFSNFNNFSGSGVKIGLSGPLSTGPLYATMSYVMTCRAPIESGGDSVTKSVTVTINPAPTASLTVNGSKNIVANVGDTINYSWNGTGAARWDSTYSSDCSYGSGTWVANTASSVGSPNTSATIVQAMAGCNFTLRYIGYNSAGTVVVQDSVLIQIPAVVAAPTASLTVNGSKSITARVGDTINYSWNGTGAARWDSTYSSDCSYGSGTWVANTASSVGSPNTSATIVQAMAGCNFTLRYIGYNSAGTVVVQDSVLIQIPAIQAAAPTAKQTQTASAVNAFSNTANTGASQSTSGFSYTFTQDLYRGQSGDEVVALQKALKAEELFAEEITGNFYDKTRDAAMAFQEKYGISATGYVGPATRGKLNELYSK